MSTFGIVLGHVVSLKGIEVDKGKIEISKLPSLKRMKEVISFLGYVWFCRRFIKDFNAIFSPLYNLLIKDTPFKWTKDCQKPFKKIINLLT